MKIGILFPGYGSQYVGMAKELYDNSRIVQEYFEEASLCLNMNFVKLCYASSDIELAKIENAYPALFLVSSAVAALIKNELGVTPTAVAGHGIGEHGALHIAGGLNFPDGLYLVRKLANFYTNIREELDAKSVSVEGISAKKLDLICKENSTAKSVAKVAIYENKDEHVVTGHADAVDAVAESASDAGASTEEIEWIEGFHSPLLNDLSEQLKIYLIKIDFKDLSFPLIASTDCKEVVKAKKAQDAIMRQIIKPVYWSNVLKYFADYDVIIVPAPSKNLVAEIQAYYPGKTVIGIDTLADIDILKTLLNIQSEKESELQGNI